MEKKVIPYFPLANKNPASKKIFYIMFLKFVYSLGNVTYSVLILVAFGFKRAFAFSFYFLLLLFLFIIIIF